MANLLNSKITVEFDYRVGVYKGEGGYKKCLVHQIYEDKGVIELESGEIQVVPATSIKMHDNRVLDVWLNHSYYKDKRQRSIDILDCFIRKDEHENKFTAKEAYEALDFLTNGER